MKFSCSTIIKAPVDHVVNCFTSVTILRECQKGFLSKESIEGVPWEVGSTSLLKYKKLVLKETILLNALPVEFKALYEHKHMVNTMHCSFIALDIATTRMVQEIHYTLFIGYIPKLMANLFPGLFKKQVQKWLDRFKDAVEKKQPL